MANVLKRLLWGAGLLSVRTNMSISPFCSNSAPQRSDVSSHRPPHGYRLVGNPYKSKMLVVGVDERVLKIIELLTSPLAIKLPGPSLPPFPCFAHPHHVIALNGPKYGDTFDVKPPPNLLNIQTPSLDVAPQIIPTSLEHHVHSVVCALPIQIFHSDGGNIMS
jgi:hypothetical protein